MMGTWPHATFRMWSESVFKADILRQLLDTWPWRKTEGGAKKLRVIDLLCSRKGAVAAVLEAAGRQEICSSKCGGWIFFAEAWRWDACGMAPPSASWEECSDDGADDLIAGGGLGLSMAR